MAQTFRVVFLLLLTLGTVPMQAAAQEAPQGPQAQPAICFPGKDRDVAGGQNPNAACRGDIPPSYLEGQPVTIDLDAVVGINVRVSARCVGGCPAGDVSSSRVYWATYSGEPIVFPRDFFEPPPGQTVGPSAVGDQAPRFNSTWEVEAQFPASPIARQFLVWLYDADKGVNYTVHPGEMHTIRSSGLSPGTTASMRLERRDPATGKYLSFMTIDGHAGSTGDRAGVFEDSFRLPVGEALNITQCGRALLDCYRMTVLAQGKTQEMIPVQVAVADITRGDTTPRPSPTALPAFERSQNVTFDIDLYYPGGRLHLGPKLTPTEVPPSILFKGERALRVAVEKIVPNGTITTLDTVPLSYQPDLFVWRAQWTIPKDLPIDDTVRYRLRLVQQQDIYGNIVREDVLGTFTVDPANLRPRYLEHPGELQRTQEGVVRVAILYHNGTPYTPDDSEPGNRSPFRGCFVRVPDDPAPPAPPTPRFNRCAPDDPLTWGVYRDGAWDFKIRYPRDHPELGLHRFIFENATDDDDRYGNVVLGPTEIDFNRNFVVVPAKPNVTFSTVMRGAEAEILERGNRVYVSAEIKYHDGSPYNHLVRVDPNTSEARELSGILVRRGPSTSGEGYGPIASEETFNLTEIDPSVGRWGAFLSLTDDDTFTPAGIWTFRFDIVDNLTVPNSNATSIDREVVASTIVLCPVAQPVASAATGTTVKFRFKLYYSECDTGREVPEGAILSKISARVHRFDPTRQLVGTAVSNVLVPIFARDTSRDWGLEYEVANELFAGSYVVVVTGADAFGNKILPNARSRPFSTFTEIVERTVLSQPPPNVERGESATVVFDARERDTGLDPRRPPTVALERFDSSTSSCDDGEAQGGCWVRERADVRLFDPTLVDHLGVFPVDVGTPVGVYRFVLQGRDASFRVIRGVSENFTIEPTVVARAMITTPPESVVKGVAFTYYLEQQPGDRYEDRAVFRDGRSIRVPNAQISYEGFRVNVTWAIPFEAPAGNYTIQLRGHDVNGNELLYRSPPIEALSASLEGRILGQPSRVTQRGDVAKLQFAVSYPDGSFYAAAEEPVVYVRNATGLVGTATLRREGLSFAASWRVPSDAAVGDHYFEVSPQATGATGNAFPPLRSNTFRIAPGFVTRATIDGVGASFERLTGASYSVAFEPDDKFVAFELVYYGPARSDIIDPQEKLPAITKSPIPHTIDPAAGKYVARVVTDEQSQTGIFRIAMTGEDAEGNRLQAVSSPFVIDTTTILVQPDRPPGQAAFGDGKEITLSYVLKYSIGTIMDDSYGRPSAVLLYAPPTGGERPVSQRPDVEYLDGRWYVTWKAPDNLPDGTYTFTLGGEDAFGNRIASARSVPYIVETTVKESFMKTVPGPSPILLLFALVGIAALVGGRARRSK